MIVGDEALSRAPRAILFDLYGTLVRTERPVIHKELPRLLGIGGREWMTLARRHLMTTNFPDREAFIRFILENLSIAQSSDIYEKVDALLECELESIRPMAAVHSTLNFLSRRGFLLGLMSNLSSIHKEPLARYDLERHFKATALSCDQGMMKPEPRLYLDLCTRLGVEPEEVLAVGDSLRNDVRGPRALGMQALLVSNRGDGKDERVIRDVSELGWLDLEGDVEPIITSGDTVRMAGSEGRLQEIRRLPDSGQGRLNLVAAATLGENRQEVFCKRFLFKEAVHVEEMMHRILDKLGMTTCEVAILSGPEPVLVATRAPGKKFESCTNPVLAFEIGRHCAVSYIFANADLRPRNTFVADEDNRPVVTMIDLEHSLFNMALDVDGLDEPNRPETFDRMPADELRRRLKRCVLNERTTRRAMGTFLKLDSLESEMAVAFRSGWVAAFRQIQSESALLCRWIEERIYEEPFVIIGTRAYRRAMAKIDVDDIRSRIDQDPEELFPRLAAVRRARTGSGRRQGSSD